MSNPDDLSHNEIISNLFGAGASDLFSDESIEELTGNQKFLEDIEF